MSVAPGSRLGPYEIVAPLGAGGMGEVWKARDTRLDRSVAIKLLPAEFADNAQLRLRLEREARLISQLSHPNICTLFDVGSNYLVMELLEGESLADRLTRGPLPLGDVLKAGVQIAEALGKAHRQGVVHRDLKPGNIMMTRSGAKLLDFGLAKSIHVSPAPDGATEQKPLTQEGTILGTFQYMAPEQLAGEEPDARTDIFALGSVLYEMATGRRAFEGKTKTSLIGAIVSGEPKPILEFQPLAPRSLEHVIKKCLAKEPDDRWQSASDVAEALRWIGESSAAEPVATVKRRRVGERMAWTVAALAIIAAALLGWRQWRSRGEAPPPLRVNLTLPEHSYVAALAMSRDRVVAYTGSFGLQPGVFLRPLNRFDVAGVPDTTDAVEPFFSPDGEWVAYFARGALKKVGVNGGAPVSLCSNCVSIPMGGVWGEDGNIYFADRSSGIYRISAAGGAPVAISKPDPAKDELSHRLPQMLPDGKHLLVTIKTGTMATFDDAQIAVMSIVDGKVKVVLNGGTAPVYAGTGHLLFIRNGKLFAVKFDLARLETSGAPFPIVENIRYDPPSGRASFAISGDSLVYAPGQWASSVRLTAIDAAGHEEVIAQEPYDMLDPQISPDGTRIAFVRRAANDHIVVLDLARQTLSRITFDHGNSYSPVWTPDGRSIIYWRENAGNGESALVQCATDGSGSPVELIRSHTPMTPTSVSPDGKLLAYEEGTNIWLLSLEDHRRIGFAQRPFAESGARFSPDGRWIAYVSHETGKPDVYVRSVSGSGERWLVSTDGGRWPRWSRDGRSIFYVRNDGVMRADVESGKNFSAARPVKVFSRSIVQGDYSILADGRLLVREADEQPETHQLNVVLHFFDELRQKTP